MAKKKKKEEEENQTNYFVRNIKLKTTSLYFY